MIIKIENITAHPFKNFDLFCEQLENRKKEINNIIENNNTFKMLFLNNDYIIVSPGFKGNKFQRTYFTSDNEPLSHTTYDNIKDLLKDSYINYDIQYIEI